MPTKYEAKRYSGTLCIELAYNDVTSSYNAHITEMNDDARFDSVSGIRLPPASNHLAVDSDTAWDIVAEAVLGFASYEDDSVYNFVDFESEDSDKFKISRQKS
ncbi:MAG: hypothetical protein JWO15_3543 [Sphingomonadales bacterium]|nr:hypothetical protein [Sphingomonadales bacterium]